MKFATAINCLDGRIQVPVIKYLQKKFDTPYIDIVSEPGICAIISNNADKAVVDNIYKKIQICLDKGSIGMAVIGHHDCRGNPSSQEVQEKQILKSIQMIKTIHKDLDIIGLWIDKDSNPHEVTN